MIRPLTIDDLERVAAIEADAEQRFDALGLELTLPNDPSPGHELREAIEDGLAFGFDDGGLVGFLYGSVVGDAAFIEEVSVLTSASGRRIGASLIDRFEQAGRELGLTSVLLTTFADVPWNAPYYARLGFETGAGSRGATLLSAESTRGFAEEQRVAMQRPIQPVVDGLVTECFPTEHADPGLLAQARLLMDVAFEGDFSDHDWAHALGGLHAVVRQGSELLAHAAAVPRTLFVGANPWDCAYIEAVAVDPAHQRSGLGTRVMRSLAVRMRSRFDLLALSSGEKDFYTRLGWQQWEGPTFVRRGTELERTRDDDGGIFVLAGLRPLPRLSLPLGCEDRPGEVW